MFSCIYPLYKDNEEEKTIPPLFATCKLIENVGKCGGTLQATFFDKIQTKALKN